MNEGLGELRVSQTLFYRKLHYNYNMTLCSLFNLQINMDKNIELIIFFVDKNSIVCIMKLTININ